MKNFAFEPQYQEKGIASQRQYPNDHLIAFIARNFYKAPDRKAIKILELGTGSGAQLWYLAHEGFSAYGTDNSPTGIALCKDVLAKWGVSATLEVCDMTAIPDDWGHFDAIVDVVSMQHLDIEDHAKAYATIHARLKPGGKFFSYHLGKGSCIAPKEDYTIENQSDETLPLANNGLMTFLDTEKAKTMLSAFTDVTIEKLLRSYGDKWIEYLIISAQKTLSN